MINLSTLPIQPPLLKAVTERHTLFLIHAGGIVALLAGAWNLLEVSRRRFLNLHRWLGRLYLTGVLAGGFAGLALSTTAQGGLTARIGFAMLAVLWIVNGVMAYLRINPPRLPSVLAVVASESDVGW